MTAGFARTVSNGRSGFPDLLEAIEAHLASHAVPPATTAQLMVVFDEIVSNAIDYGGGEGRAPTVTVSLGVDRGRITGEVADDGKRFDPLAAASPDISLSAEERAIGGLGIHLVRELTDEIDYRYESGRNRLRFSKNYPVS